MPCGSRPSMAALTRSGARKASEIAMLTFRALQFSRKILPKNLLGRTWGGRENSLRSWRASARTHPTSCYAIAGSDLGRRKQWPIMTKDEIVDEVISLLRDHKAGRRGSIHQDPYKHDFFRLFATAYNAGMMKSGSPDFLRADALTEMIATRAPELVEGEVWQGLYGLWSAWTYTWDHGSELRR